MTRNNQVDQPSARSASTEVLVVMREVTKTFQSGLSTFSALRDVSLTLARGSYVAVVGRSGSGKSTLLNMLTGIDRPTSGSVEVFGRDLGALSEGQLTRFRGANIGIVFQFFQLIPTLTVLENLLLAMELVGVISAPQRAPRAGQLLEQVGIADQADKLPAALSGGQQQRAAIARALANDPALIVADEPTGNLDSQTAAAINELFCGLARTGKSVVVVTHDLGTMARYDHVVRLTDGRVEGVSSSEARAS
jgi:putative ABC transport system ATP-binding protein